MQILNFRNSALVMGFILITSIALDAQIFSSKTGKVSFSSHAPLEDIYSESNKLNSALNIKTKKVASKVAINTMIFENSLQQEHFNEKYMESHEYPTGQFTGELQTDADLSKPGVYKVTAVGQLVLHGVGRERKIPVTLTVKENSIEVESTFKVTVADHKIEIPQLVFQKVAEVVEVNLKTTLNPYKKKRK